jgi:hypothetical protein
MTDTRRSNKKAGSEDEVGEIHNLTTKLHLLRLRKMITLISAGADAEDVIGDGKALLAAGKWSADQNSITCAQPEDDKESELAKRLAFINKEQAGKGARANGTNVSFMFDDEDQ